MISRLRTQLLHYVPMHTCTCVGTFCDMPHNTHNMHTCTAEAKELQAALLLHTSAGAAAGPELAVTPSRVREREKSMGGILSPPSRESDPGKIAGQVGTVAASPLSPVAGAATEASAGVAALAADALKHEEGLKQQQQQQQQVRLNPAYKSTFITLQCLLNPGAGKLFVLAC